MSGINIDSDIRDKLNELRPWEVALLNKLYPTMNFDSLNSFFHETSINLAHIHENLISIFALYKAKALYSTNLSFHKYGHFRNPYGLRAHDLPSFSQIHTSKSSEIDYFSFGSTEKIDQERVLSLFSLLNNLLDSSKNNQFDLFISLSQFLVSAQTPFYFSDSPGYLDVLVLSVVTKCKITKRIVNNPNPAEKTKNFVLWHNELKLRYPEIFDYPKLTNVTCKRYINQTAKKLYNMNSCPEFIEAVRNSEYEKVSFYLEQGFSVEIIDPSKKNVTALHIACSKGDLEMIKLLERYGADFEAKDFEHLTPVYYAIFGEHFEVLDYLIAKGVNLENKDHQDRTPFYCACCQCSVKMVEYLYKKGCNMNSETKLKRVPLAKAAYFGRGDVVKLLLTYKDANINIKDHKERTALHNSCWGKDGGREGKKCGSNMGQDTPEAARALLEYGADIEVRDCDGNTPLCTAASTYGDRCIPILMEFGAKINAVNFEGESPVFQASKFGYKDICKDLIEKYSADPFLKSNSGFDSLGVAIVKQHHQLVYYYMEKFEEKICSEQEYFESIIQLVSFNLETKIRNQIILNFLEKKLNSPFGKLYKTETVKALINCKDQVILDKSLQLLKFAFLNDPNENILEYTLKELISCDWLYGIDSLLSQFTSEFALKCWNLFDLVDPATITSDIFMYLIEHFNVNPFLTNTTNPHLLHHLVKNRNTDIILSFLNLIDNISDNAISVSNQFFRDFEKNLFFSFFNFKNSEGLTPLDYSLMLKYYDIHNILKKYEAGKGESKLSLIKFNYKFVEKSSPHCHSQKEKLATYYENYKTNTNVDLITLDFNKLRQAEILRLKITQFDFSNSKKMKESLLKREFHYIDTEQSLSDIVLNLNSQEVLGIDLEYYQETSNKIGVVCIMQISTIETDYVIDAIKLHNLIQIHLGPLFLSEKIVKIFHGCDNDLKWLKYDFDIDVVNIFDTSRAVMLIKDEKFSQSLAVLTNNYLGFFLDKSYQKADWRIRPLPNSMIEYARMDSSVLLYVWAKLDSELDSQKRQKLAMKMMKKAWKAAEQMSNVKVDVELV